MQLLCIYKYMRIYSSTTKQCSNGNSNRIMFRNLKIQAVQSTHNPSPELCDALLQTKYKLILYIIVCTNT